MYKMTPREALKIQADQVAHYARLCDNLEAKVAEKTDIEWLDLDVEIDVSIINKRIPRGGAIEYLCGIK